ncbi:hypothetical protein D9M72_625130 [compost metagenome]
MNGRSDQVNGFVDKSKLTQDLTIFLNYFCSSIRGLEYSLKGSLDEPASRITHPVKDGCTRTTTGAEGVHLDRGHGHDRHRCDPCGHWLSELLGLCATRQRAGGAQQPVELPRPTGAALPGPPHLRQGRRHMRH